MKKRVLVTGYKGFIGSHIFSYLMERGYDVLGLDEDIRDKESMRLYFLNVDLVIHAAGETQDQNNEELCHDINVLGTKNVIELCIEKGCKLIHLSSTARKLAYGRSKQESQQLVDNSVKDGLKAIVLRLCPILKLDDPLTIPGRNYSIEALVVDIDLIIMNNNFDEFEIVDYKEVIKKYEKSPDIR